MQLKYTYHVHLAAHSEVDLQELADCFATAAKSFGLTVSIKKTEVLRQLAPNTARPPPNITMDGNALKNVDTFKYLGSCINSAANLDDEVLCRISRASQAFGRLHTRVWHERGISIKTKLSVYRAVVLPSLLYGCETWILLQAAYQETGPVPPALPSQSSPCQLEGPCAKPGDPSLG